MNLDEKDDITLTYWTNIILTYKDSYRASVYITFKLTNYSLLFLSIGTIKPVCNLN